MSTLNPFWHDARTQTTRPLAPPPQRALLNEIKAVFAGMFVQVSPPTHARLDAHLREDMGLR